MAEIYLRYPGGRFKAFTMSYDDGMEYDRRLIGIMRENGLCGTFNINSGLFAPEGTVYPEGTINGRLTASQASATYRGEGIEVAVHGYAHPFLESLPTATMLTELLRDRAELEKMFGCIVRGAALPYGTCNDEIREALKLCGFSYCRGVGATLGFALPDERLPFTPTMHHSHPALAEKTDFFVDLKASKRPLLFYLWGHSYEFGYGKGQNSWEAITGFCQRIGGHDDIWYATNGEIFDYADAYRQLRVSLDGKILSNPTATTLYLSADGKPLSVAPGETVRLA